MKWRVFSFSEIIIYDEYIILKDSWINEEFLYKDPPVNIGFQITGLSVS